MPRPRTPTQLAATLACIAFAVFVYWYQGAAPLTPDEVERYMLAIERQPAASHGSLDLPALRRFFETDDGQPFYNVNLFKLRDHARYPDQELATVSGAQAFERYSAFMLRTLPKRACHVVFGTTRSLSDDWDMIATARYRSRRDLAELFASPEFASAVTHKWAALADNVRVPVQARGLFATAYLPVAALLSLLVLAVHGVERLAAARKRFMS